MKAISRIIVAAAGMAFGLAWWFRYEPIPPGGYVWDRWTRQMCQSDTLSKGWACNGEIELARIERKEMDCLATLNAIDAPLRQDAAKLIRAGFTVAEVTKWATNDKGDKDIGSNRDQLDGYIKKARSTGYSDDAINNGLREKLGEAPLEDQTGLPPGMTARRQPWCE
jgi:hypothetical protein